MDKLKKKYGDKAKISEERIINNFSGFSDLVYGPIMFCNNCRFDETQNNIRLSSEILCIAIVHCKHICIYWHTGVVVNLLWT